MRIKLLDAAFSACFVLASAMVVIAGSKGLGSAVDPALEFWTLEAMHAAFLLAFVPSVVAAWRERKSGAVIAYALPLASFAFALVLSFSGSRFPGPVLIAFDLYLIVASVLRFARPAEPAAPTEAAYREVPGAEAYALLNTGGLVLVCTKGGDGRYDLAPFAWSCPLDYEPTSRVLIVMDPGHQTVKNIEAAGAFALALPTFRQRALVDKTGSVSGRDQDKYAAAKIGALRGKEVDAMIPDGVAGHLECRVLEIRRVGTVAVIAGEVVYARAVENAWKQRLHYAGENAYYRPYSQEARSVPRL